MTTENAGTDPNAGAARPSLELRELLADLLQQPTGPAAEPLLEAVRAELDAREVRAYASGWQDALEALRGSPPA